MNKTHNFRHGCVWTLCTVVAWMHTIPCIVADEAALQETPAEPPTQHSVLLERGATIYREQCASCHGDQGQGVDGLYKDRLVGDDTTGELTKLITTTMPKDEADQCVGEDAKAVAEFIHYSFYSDAAQIRNRPPRIGLARLTANQLRQSIADLYAHFDGIVGPTRDRGVKAIYFNGHRWKNEEKKIERVDPVIDFDFGRESPGEGIDAKSFYIYWEGGLKADVTGRYEIIVRSTCSFVMDFGKIGRQFFDNHVQSGDKTEFRQTVTLTAGRVYPFKIDFIQRERKTELPPAVVSLSWIPPRGVEEIIPTRQLIPYSPQATFSLQTTLPPDDRSYGYERGIAISREWDDSTTAAALEFADIAVAELWPRYQRIHKKDANENRAQLRSFLAEVVETAFRISLNDDPGDKELRQRHVDQQVDTTPDDAEAIRRVVLLALKSPRFLYPLADQTQPQSHRAANRLALVMFDSLPSDEWLQKLARQDKLKTEEQIKSAAYRMVSDYRTQAKTLALMHAWLNLDHLHDINKDQQQFPGFNDELEHDLRTSLNAFIEDTIWSDASDFRQLLLAERSYTTDRIAEFYGDAWKAESDEGPRLRMTGADGTARLGLLNHPFLMSGLAYHDSTSPIHRGVFLIRYMLGRTLRPPAEAFTPLSPDLHPDLTTRERVALQTSPEGCQVCHLKINGLGFALENYDAVGRFRTKEHSKNIDSAGRYADRSGAEVSFSGAAELARFLAESDDAHRSFVNRAFQHFVKQPPAAYGTDTLEKLTKKFRESGYNIRELIVQIAAVAAKIDNEPTTP
ncbi:MAG: DUF1588 domain-containing protein [Fuerstiella sp.]